MATMEEWVIAWGPRLALLGAAIATLGAFVAALGAWGTTQQQSREQVEHARQVGELRKTVATKAEENARLTRENRDAITDGDSFCYLHFVPTEGQTAGQTDLHIWVHRKGEFPLRDVAIQVKNREMFNTETGRLGQLR